jgi:hypothetical protein
LIDHAALPDCGNVRLERGEDLADLGQHLDAPNTLLKVVRVRGSEGQRVRARGRVRVRVRAKAKARARARARVTARARVGCLA